MNEKDKHMKKNYASTFVSFMLNRLGSGIERIDRVILYGSAARGEATKESDIDIFIDTKEDLEGKIEKILNEFYDSREAALFKVYGIANEISVKVGELKKWKELHRSITSGGIMLWGRFETKEKPIGTSHKIIFFWDKIEKNRGAFLNKLYGFSSQGRRYEGLLEKWDGGKTGKSSVIIPLRHKEEMLGILKKYGVNAKNIEVFTME